MPSLFNRHPRYTLFTAFVLLSTLLMLASQRSPPPMPTSLQMYDFPEDADPLERRLLLSERSYQRMLLQRKGLLKKFGPMNKLVMFPPDQPPWPAYTVWDFFPPSFNCPHEVERIGALGDGGKWVCGLSRVTHKRNCVVYSIGINNESSFEADILENTTHCQVWGYDFTVKSFGPEIPKKLLHRAHFKPYKLGGTDADSSTPGHEDEDYKTFTLARLMEMNKHTHIDILKVDIEGAEFDTLKSLVKAYVEAGEPLPIGQLQLEVHLWDRNDKFKETLEFWEMLEDAGLRPFWTEPNLVYQNFNRDRACELAEYSFLNIHGSNEFIMNKSPLGKA